MSTTARIRNAWGRFRQSWTSLRLVGLAILVAAVLIEKSGLLPWGNASTELASMAITMLFVDWLYQRRETEREKKRLILQMGSPDNAFAREAARALRLEGWLQDGAVREADLESANLQGSNLEFAKLEGTYLRGANLQNASLVHAALQNADLVNARLQNARLVRTNLQGAALLGAKLQGADLVGGNLQGAHLEFAHLQKADLRRANLQDATLRGARYNEATRWPEGFTPPADAVNEDETPPPDEQAED